MCENGVKCEHPGGPAWAPAEHRPKAAGVRGKRVQLEPWFCPAETEPAWCPGKVSICLPSILGLCTTRWALWTM